MIHDRKQLEEYLIADAKANRKKNYKEWRFGDECWKFIKSYRKLEYYSSQCGIKKVFLLGLYVIEKIRFHSLSLKCGFSIPLNCFDSGMSIAHRGCLVVNGNARIGKNCRIHEGVTIGTTGGSNKAPRIGNNVFIGSGAKIIGDIEIADDVAIGANAVVVKSILEKGTTWAGNPAKKISDNDSHSFLSSLLDL